MAADSVHDSGGCTYDQTTRVKAAPPKLLLPSGDPAPFPPTQFLHFLSSSLSQDHLESQASPRSLAIKGNGRTGGEAGEWHHSLLTRVSTWRVRTGLSVSGPASARHTAPLMISSSNSRSGRSKGRRVMIEPGQSTRIPGQAVRVRARDQDRFPHSRPDWYGRVYKALAPPPPPLVALPPLCPHLLEGKRLQNSLTCDGGRGL